MNMKLMILGGILVIAMVMFGNNPVEEARKKEQEKYKGIDDPLIKAITEYNEENPMKAARGNGLDENGRPTRYMPNYMYPPEHYNANTTNQYYNGNAMTNSMPPAQNNTANQNTQTQQRSGYYPPPPLPKNSLPQNSRFKPYNQQAPAPNQGALPPESRNDGHMYLRSGERLSYSGQYVYTVDENGYRKPLPDGTYYTESGLELNIQGGRKIIASN